MIKKLVSLVLVLVLLGLVGIYAIGTGFLGELERPSDPTATPRPALEVSSALAKQRDASRGIGAATTKQILFGDLHVHTTVSFDAFILSLPPMGEGSHPQSDACDFARYCSALDFWSINDHAGAITPLAWRQTVESIRQCNDVASDPQNPDTVAFLGWEWTQVGSTPENHYGHKNVVLAHLDDARIPSRPIASTALATQTRRSAPSPFSLGVLALSQQSPRFDDLARYYADRSNVSLCDADTPVRDLPSDCMELAETPGDLFRKLDDWGHDAIVIPHGTTWGMYGPAGTSWDKQLTRSLHDPDRQILFEIYSGHGSSEVARDWRSIEQHADGSVSCPAVRSDYLPPCWRAGEIIRERCLEDGESDGECDARAVKTRQIAAEAGLQAHLTVPGYDPEEWLDAGQCRDCSEPAFNYRPGGSAQYVMALSNFDESGDRNDPLRFRFGFMASSDNHYARPGTGFKEVHRIGSTESRDRIGESPLSNFLTPPRTARASEPVAFDREASNLAGFQLFEMERQSSYFTTGGLIAVHSEGRDRGSIWSSMLRRETYGTSGPRILLWFDLLNPPGSRGRPVPMGTAVESRDSPIFQARAVGSFEQKPGCPDYVTNNMAPQQIEHVCRGECYNPSDRRRLITRIEVIRVRPQQVPGEPIAALVEDPWRSFACDPDPSGCAVTFADPEYSATGRDTLYYVRAIEEPKLAINAGGFRCERDAAGECLKPILCGTPGAQDDCLAETEPRAWSSPIFLDWPADASRAANPGHTAPKRR